MLLIIFILIFLTLFFIFIALSSIPEKGWIKREQRIEKRLRGLGEEEVAPSILRDELLSEIPTFDQFLDRYRLARSFNLLLNRANIRIRVGEFYLLSLFLMFLGLYLCAKADLPGVLILLGGLLFGVSPIFYVLGCIKRRKEKFLEQFPDALDLMNSGLRSGYTLQGSLRILAEEMEEPVGAEFQRAIEQMDLGLDTLVVLDKMMGKMNLPELNLFVTAVRIQKETGGNLTEILDKISLAIREKQKVKGHLRAITAQGRFTGTVLSVLPLIIVGIMLMTNQDYLDVLFSSPAGVRLLQVSAVSLLIGALLIKRIVTFRGF